SRERGGRNRGRGVIRGRALAPDAVRGRRADFSVLDVREEAAFRQGHIAGSGHVPRSELRLRRSEPPPREQPLLVVAADAGEAAAAAARHGVRITTAVTDLEHDAITLPPDRFQLVVCFRYLHRPLFRQLERTLAPGGFLVYETYRLGQEKLGRPRRERFLLRPGELASAFPSLIVEHYAELEPAGGPVTARLLARKPG